MNRKDRAPFDKFGKKLQSAFYEIEDFKQFEELFDKIIAKSNDYLLPIRKILIKENFTNKKPSFKAIINQLENL